MEEIISLFKRLKKSKSHQNGLNLDLASPSSAKWVKIFLAFSLKRPCFGGREMTDFCGRAEKRVIFHCHFFFKQNQVVFDAILIGKYFWRDDLSDLQRPLFFCPQDRDSLL